MNFDVLPNKAMISPSTKKLRAPGKLHAPLNTAHFFALFVPGTSACTKLT